MIEREFIKEQVKYMKVREHILTVISKSAGVGIIDIEKTPLGERIVISAVKPGLVIGRAGKSISDLTRTLRLTFKLENPQIEVRELAEPMLNSQVVANRIVADFERFGAQRYKAIGHRMLQNVMRAGALGAEIRISGRGLPSTRAHSWPFSAGHMKKSGQVALDGVDKFTSHANLRTGSVGIKVMIMHPNIYLPDKVVYITTPEVQPMVETEPAPVIATKAPVSEPVKPKKEKVVAKEKPEINNKKPKEVETK